jgi:putative peptidoglycan lipid II flippase
MKRIPKQALIGKLSLGNAAALLVGASFFSQVLGFMRTKLVNANFLATGPHSTDAYFAAFNIPDFFYFTLAAGALGVAFMPVLAEHLHKGDNKGIWELSDSLLNLLAVIMLVVAVVIFVFARPLISHVVAPKLTAPQLHNAVIIMRLLSINPFLFTISGILSSVQQTFGRFFFYAIAPLFYNLSIIISIYLFKNNIGLVGLGIGALAGAVIQLIVILFGLINTNFHYHFHIMWRSSDFKRILRNLPARSLDQGMDQVESIVETNFATRIGQGYVSYYANAYTLSTAPSLLIGTAISTAAFPRLTLRLAQGRSDLFRKDFLRILRIMIWITMPVVVVSYFSRGYLARLIFSRDSSQISLLFGYLTLAIFFRTIYALVSRWFYAQNDTKTPLFVSIFTISLNILLAYILTRPYNYGAVGLALAQSLVAMTEVLVLFLIMVIRDHKLLDKMFFGGLLRIISVTGFSALAGFIMITLLPLDINDRGFTVLGAKLALITGVIFLVHVGVSSLFGLEEATTVISRIKRIILKPIRLDY